MCVFVHCYERNEGLALNLIRPNKHTSQLEIEQGRVYPAMSCYTDGSRMEQRLMRYGKDGLVDKELKGPLCKI